MNIGFDGKRAVNNLTGLGNYSRSLIAHMAEYFPQNQYFVYSSKVKDQHQIQSFLNAPGVVLKLAASGFLWRSFGILKQLKNDGIQVYHGLSQELPFRISATGIKSIVTIHDLIYLRFPQYYPFIDRLIYKFKAKYACKHADGIIAISENTKRDLVHLLKIPAEKIKVIYQSCDESFKQEFSLKVKQEIREKYQLPGKYLLNVGTIEPRKNLMLIVKAMATLPSDISLVVIGKTQAYAVEVQQEITRLNLKDRVVFLKDVSFLDLPVIYQLATLFVYPSVYEGFGIPIIEALYSKIPVIAATGSCLEEAGGPDSLYIDPHSPEALSQAIQVVLTDNEKQSRMIEKGLQYAQRFDKMIVSNEIDKYYKEVAGLNFQV
jgi:glycosyltransferase involved in cell wall biosynthesis